MHIHAVERRVRRNHAGLEQLRQTVDLEDAGTTLGVAGKLSLIHISSEKAPGETPLTRFAGAPLKEGSRDPVRYWLPSTEGSQRNQAS